MPRAKKAAIPEPMNRLLLSRIPVAILVSFAGLVLAFLTLRANSPTLYDSNVSVSEQSLTVTITNKGRTARIQKGWCGAGVYLTSGSTQITQIEKALTPDLLRRTSMAPDEQDTLEMLAPNAIDPAAAARFNPLWASINPSTIWDVACTIPYEDTLGKWVKSDTLKFCYEIQPSGQGIERHAVMCPPDVVDKTIKALGGQL